MAGLSIKDLYSRIRRRVTAADSQLQPSNVLTPEDGLTNVAVALFGKYPVRCKWSPVQLDIDPLDCGFVGVVAIGLNAEGYAGPKSLGIFPKIGRIHLESVRGYLLCRTAYQHHPWLDGCVRVAARPCKHEFLRASRFLMFIVRSGVPE